MRLLGEPPGPPAPKSTLSMLRSGAAVAVPGRVVESASATSSQSSPVVWAMLARRVIPSAEAAPFSLSPVARRAS